MTQVTLRVALFTVDDDDLAVTVIRSRETRRQNSPLSSQPTLATVLHQL